MDEKHIKRYMEGKEKISALASAIITSNAPKNEKDNMELLLKDIAFLFGRANGIIARYEDLLEKHKINPNT
jgi:hypothetical protein